MGVEGFTNITFLSKDEAELDEEDELNYQKY